MTMTSDTSIDIPIDFGIDPGIAAALLARSTEGVLVVGRAGRITAVNAAASGILGWAPGDLVGQDLTVVVPGVLKERHARLQAAFLDGPPAQRLMAERTDVTGVRRDGSEFPAQVSILRLDVAEDAWAACLFRDVTRQRATETLAQNLAVRNEMLANCVRSANIGVCVLSAEGADLCTLYANDAMVTLSGDPALDWRGHPPRFFQPNQEYRDMLGRLARNEEGQFEAQLIDWRGREHFHIVSLFVMDDNRVGGRVRVAVHQDVTELRQIERLAREAGRFDPLTLLPGRALLEDRIAMRIEQDLVPFAVVQIDVTNLQQINAVFGHTFGDATLKAFAERLVQVLDWVDIIARVGSTRFATLIPILPEEDAFQTLLGRVRRILGESLDALGATIRVSGVLGVAWHPDHDATPEGLLRKADMACEAAQLLGDSAWQAFHPDMEADVRHRLEIIDRSRDALAANEFFLVFQPQLDLTRGAVSGVEALIRWRMRDGRMIPPISFIEIAEQTGFITDLGHWVMVNACKAAARVRRAMGRPVRVGVNVSALQFQGQDLAAFVAAAKRDADDGGVPLDIEITETSVLRNLEETGAMLERIRAGGDTVSIDDFGCGYSSLSHLAELPADRIKLDKHFAGRLGVDPRSDRLVQGMVTLCRELGFTTLLEGVETEAQLRRARDLGITEVQGYHIARPMPEEALVEWLREREP